MIESAGFKTIKLRLLPVLAVFIITILSETGLYFLFRDFSLERIKERGKLIVLTENNANSYYLYRDTPMGFEYELAKAFADHLGVELEISVPGWSRLFEDLLSGRGDLIAAGISITEERQALVDFSHSYMPVRQYVIVHKNNYDIKDTNDLSGQAIHIRQGTTYEERLKAIQNTGIRFTIISHKEIATEELIQLVAARQIPLTIADSNIALLNRRYYPDIKLAFPIEDEQHLAWAVRRGEKALLNEVNAFLRTMKKNGTLERIHHQYYSAVDAFDYVDLKKFHRRLRTRLPAYRKTIEEQAEIYGFDWRLIAAVIYQESHFDPLATSYTGVKGLMQLTEPTAFELGINDRLDPVQSIMGGVEYLARLRARFKDIRDPHTRLLFTLAAYNIGYGHVRDAQQIARELGFKGASWQALKIALPLLRNKKYYEGSLHGYARGTEPIHYVNRVMAYYDILKQKALESDLL